MSKDSTVYSGGDFLRWEHRGTVCISFALGMLVASLFPYRLAMLIIAAIIILAGLSLCRY